jgi:hypothetical protein
MAEATQRVLARYDDALDRAVRGVGPRSRIVPQVRLALSEGLRQVFSPYCLRGVPQLMYQPTKELMATPHGPLPGMGVPACACAFGSVPC